jgi:hypothetical protein
MIEAVFNYIFFNIFVSQLSQISATLCGLITLLPNTLDDFVEEENPARVLNVKRFRVT